MFLRAIGTNWMEYYSYMILMTPIYKYYFLVNLIYGLMNPLFFLLFLLYICSFSIWNNCIWIF
ncbi:hypothetical protein GIB67_011624 [Kingdonia uniflora]|uniref:Uncharacterized protein n=1 Tax=Kingdonia uniflora TaxID=39325 RepID=A0A7J7NM08_9MAGN|nr:hypothetical protein GIB67_011624 [Kingdonia uniflora]